MKFSLFLVGALALAGCSKSAVEPANSATAAGCGDGASGIVVSDAWVRAADAGRPATAAYLTLCNSGGEAAALVGASAQAANATEIHETKRSPDGVVQMSPVARVPLPPSTPVSFAPGGAHIMLIGLPDNLEAGGSTSITLMFEDGASITVNAPIRTSSDTGEHEH